MLVSLHALFHYLRTHAALSMVLKEMLIQVLIFWFFGVSGANVLGPETHLSNNWLTEFFVTVFMENINHRIVLQITPK